MITDTPDKRQRPVSAAPYNSGKKSAKPVCRTSSYKEAYRVYTKPLPRQAFDLESVQTPRQNCYRSDKSSHSKLKPSLDYRLGEDDIGNNNNEKCVNANVNGRHLDVARMQVATETDSESSSGSDLDEDVTPDAVTMLQRMNGQEKDEVLSEVVRLGDRVLISCPQKPPRYGKKRGRKYFKICKCRLGNLCNACAG